MSRRGPGCRPYPEDWRDTELRREPRRRDTSLRGSRRESPPYNSCMDLAALLTEQPNPASVHIDKLPTGEMLRVINREDHRVAEAVEAEIPQIERAVDGIVEALRNGGRLFYIGAGT